MEARLEPGLHAPDVAAFASTLNGRVILPTDADYADTHAVWNTLYPSAPALVVRPADAQDVARAIACAREADLEIAVRSGGHSVIAYSTGVGVMVIDLRDLRTLVIDPDSRVAVVGTGLTAGEISAAAQEHGLAIPFGDTASVGVGGITLGGGIGYLARKHGLAIDHLRSAEIVTPDGQVRIASATENPDLFWGIRGGGGNFGIATRFEFDLVEVGTVYGGGLYLPATPQVLRGIVDLATAAPDELTIIVEVMPAPPAPFIPADKVGSPLAGILMVYAGDPAEGERVADGFRRLATPVADLLGPMPYPGIYAYAEEAENPGPSSVRSLFADELDDAAIAAILERISAVDRPAIGVMQIRVLGGQMARVPVEATAFAHRQRAIMLTMFAVHLEAEAVEAEAAWIRELYSAVARLGRGVYVNFLEDEGPARIAEAYPGTTFERLVALKQRFDPENLLRRNQNIQPG